MNAATIGRRCGWRCVPPSADWTDGAFIAGPIAVSDTGDGRIDVWTVADPDAPPVATVATLAALADAVQRHAGALRRGRLRSTAHARIDRHTPYKRLVSTLGMIDEAITRGKAHRRREERRRKAVQR